MPVVRARRRIVLIILGVVAPACTEPTAPGLELHPDISGLVVGNAAAALDGAGRFVVETELGTTSEGVAVVRSDYAASLAKAFVTSYGPAFEGFWERERGSPINLDALEPSGRVFPIESPFGPVPEVGCHPADVRLFGSFYLMTLDDTKPAIHMAVSAQTTDFAVDADGNLSEPSRTGNDFFHHGIPSSGTRVITPEQAVALAARATGALITEVPRLNRRNISYSPVVALWRIDLDRDIIVRRLNGDAIQTRTVYVGPLPQERYFVAAAQQPDAVEELCSRVDENLVDSGSASISVRVLEGRTVEFERVDTSR